MIKIIEAKTKKQIKTFVDFPTKLYEGCPYYSYPLRMDEIAMFNPKKNVSYADCDVVAYLAYKDDVLVGRIAGIIQKVYNQKYDKKYVRFSRFDSTDDQEVANALLGAVEAWAKQKGMDTIIGPMGFSDLDSEGMIIDGFNERCTYEERYNHEYYVELVQNYGFTKDVDWLERKIYPTQTTDRIAKVAELVEKRYNLKFEIGKKNKLINKYKKQIFDLIDSAYEKLYGVVPLNDGMREQLLGQFKMFVDLRFMFIITNNQDEVISFGVALPALNEALAKSKGRLTIPAIFRVFKALKHPKVVDFALIAVRPDYQNKGVNALAIKYLMDNMAKFGVEYCETNLCLEENTKIAQTWDYFKQEQHRKRRAWIKKID